jgi:hypothetical protein
LPLVLAGFFFVAGLRAGDFFEADFLAAFLADAFADFFAGLALAFFAGFFSVVILCVAECF